MQEPLEREPDERTDEVRPKRSDLIEELVVPWKNAVSHRCSMLSKLNTGTQEVRS